MRTESAGTFPSRFQRGSEVQRLQAQTDTHAIDRYRVSAAVSNVLEFQKAVGCKAGMPMVKGGGSRRVW